MVLLLMGLIRVRLAQRAKKAFALEAPSRGKSFYCLRGFSGKAEWYWEGRPRITSGKNRDSLHFSAVRLWARYLCCLGFVFYICKMKWWEYIMSEVTSPRKFHGCQVLSLHWGRGWGNSATVFFSLKRKKTKRTLSLVCLLEFVSQGILCSG